MTMRRQILAVVLVMATVAVVSGCGQDTADERLGVDPGARTRPGGVPTDERTKAVAAAINQLGFEMQAELVRSGENTVTSPVSLAGLLGLLAAGAGGQAATELTTRLGLTGTRDTAIGSLLAELATTSDVQLDVANSVWTNQGVNLLAPFSDFARDTYRAEAATVALGLPEGADAIDAWARKATNDKIDSISDALGLPDPAAVTVLLNAVYFNGTWTTEFDPANTRPGTFTRADRSMVEAPMMSLHLNEGRWDSSSGDTFSLLRLPYGADQRFAMELIVPNDIVDMSVFFAGLDVDRWNAARASLAPGVESVTMPKFTTEWKANLNESLQAVGLGSIFGNDALANISDPAAPLSTVAQKVFIQVDEHGTEAAAVSGGMTATSAPAPFEVNRPFGFAITDRNTDAVLFLGAINDPTV